MSPSEFKRRFVSALPEIPPHLDLRLDEFVTYDGEQLRHLGLSAGDANWLSTIGLPRQAAPFLDFKTDNAYPEGAIPSGYFPLGSTGSGDPIALEIATGQIVRLDHEDKMKPYGINRSLSTFCECLCVIGEERDNPQPNDCFVKMLKVDPSIRTERTFWRPEVEALLG